MLRTSSVAPAGQPVTGTLTLDEAIQRGLEYNLNVVDARYNVASAQGQRRVSRAVTILPTCFVA